jgi:peptidoglycan/LPS O-acetylase OafA/YrhL
VRRNNFDVIRLLLAFSVFLSHSYPISGNPSLQTLSVWANSAIAVQGFFVISGFLIFMSYDRAASLRDYFAKRALRIYPAYFAVVMICALAGAVLSILPIQDYLSDVWVYLAVNLTFLNYLHPTLAGVFTENPIPVINGALWTIKVEAMFYLSVPILSFLFKYVPKLPAIAALYILGLLFRTLCNRSGHTSLAVQLPGQIQFFLSGALLYFYQAQFLRYANRLILPALVVAGVELYLGWVMLLPLSIGIVVIYSALCMPIFNRLRPKWDLSYGFYIWHFPILQSATLLGWFANPIVGLVASGVVTAGAACLSWLGVERRFLKSRVANLTTGHRVAVMQTQAQSTTERTV